MFTGVMDQRGGGRWRSHGGCGCAQILRQWKFQPATDNGRAVQAYGLVPIDFKLN